MSQGRRNRQLPRVATHAARRDVAPGARRARPRARPRGVRRRDARRTQAFVDFAVGVVAAARRADGARLAARPRVPGPGRRGRASAARSSGCSPSRGAATATLSIEDVPLLDELRYALGDVPQRTDDERDLDETGLLEGGVDLQELTTAAEREYAPAGRAWTPPTHRIEDDGFAHVLIDEAQDLTPDAVADGRPPRPRRVAGRSSATRRSRRGRCPPRPPRPAPRRSRARSSTSSTCRPTTATPPRSTSTPRRTPQRVGLDADLPDAVRSTGVEPRGASTGVADLEAAVRAAVAEIAGQVAGHRRHRRPGRPALRGQRLAGVVARARRRRRRRPRRRRLLGHAVSGEDRIVVLTGLDTKGLEFDGIVVVAPAGDRGRVGHRPVDALRRAHPRHPAADHRRLSPRRPIVGGSHVASPTRDRRPPRPSRRLMSRARSPPCGPVRDRARRCVAVRRDGLRGPGRAPAHTPAARAVRPDRVRRRCPRRRRRPDAAPGRSGRRSSSTTSTARPAAWPGPVAPHDRLERGRAERAGPARGRSPRPDPLDAGLGPAGRARRCGSRPAWSCPTPAATTPPCGCSTPTRADPREIDVIESYGPLKTDGRPARARTSATTRRSTTASTSATPPACPPELWPVTAGLPRRRQAVGSPSGSTTPSSPSAATSVLFEAQDGSGNRAYDGDLVARRAAGARQRRPVPPAAVQQGRRARHAVPGGDRTACSSTG